MSDANITKTLDLYFPHTLYSNQDACRKIPAAIPKVRGDFGSIGAFFG